MESFHAFMVSKMGFFPYNYKYFCKEKAKDGIEEQNILEFLYMWIKSSYLGYLVHKRLKSY